MATFLVLPPRELLEHSVNDFLSKLLPGFAPPPGYWEQIIREITSVNDRESTNPLFVVHREDLMEDGVSASLVNGFGAENGDYVIETDLPRASGPGRSRTWNIQTVPTNAAAR